MAPHLGKLAEYQGAVAHRDDFLQHLLQPGQFTRPSSDGGIVPQQLPGMIANLLQLGQGAEYRAPPLNAFGLFPSLLSLPQHRLIQGRLLPGQGTEFFGFHLLGQVADDGPVGLEPPQNEGTGGPL